MSKGPAKSWERIKQRSRISAATADSVDESRIVTAISQNGQHDYDLVWLTEMLKLPLSDQHREKVLASIEWLKGHSRRTLGGKGQGWRRYYVAIESLIAQGKYDPNETHSTPEQKHKRASRFELRAKRKQEMEAKPAWMQDPGLLPTKPPSNKR